MRPALRGPHRGNLVIFANVITVMRVDVVAMVSSLAVASFLLFGCSESKAESQTGSPAVDERPSGITLPRPPAASLRYGNVELTGGIGTYCWESACIDAVGPVTATRGVMDPGEPFEVLFEQGTPTETNVSWYSAPPSVPPVVNGEQAWSISPTEAQMVEALEAPAEPGMYILSVFARWEGKGDVSYGWYVEVK